MYPRLVTMDKLDPFTLNTASRLQRFITCTQLDHCIMCQRIRGDLGIIKWYKYEEGLWKQDEVNSLSLYLVFSVAGYEPRTSIKAGSGKRMRLMRSKFKTLGRCLASSGLGFCLFVCLLIQVHRQSPFKFYPP